MNSIIVSDENKIIVDSLKKLGFNIVFSQEVLNIIPYERKHTDIQCLKILEKFFVLKSCKRLINDLQKLGKEVIETESDIKRDYPNNVLLNALFIKNTLYCKEKSLDNSVREYCEKNNIKITNVNQGYTKCSTAVIGDYFITADKGIFQTLSNDGVEGLLIKSGDITLNGVDYGFIGGCCFYYNNTAYFTGSLHNYINGEKIISFLKDKQINIEFLSKDKLYDLGGFIVF